LISSRLTTPAPTVPKPSTPTLIGSTLAFPVVVRALRSGTDGAITLEHALDVAQCLARALFVFDQADAHISIAILAEADTRRYRDLRFAQQQLGEFQRAHILILFRDTRPGEHGGLRLVDRPADFVETVAQYVTTILIHVANLDDAILRAIE